MPTRFRVVLVTFGCLACSIVVEGCTEKPSAPQEKTKKPSGAGDDDDDPPKRETKGQAKGLRPDLNGSLFQKPGDKAVYWIDRGVRRHVVSPSVKARVFDPGVTVHEDKDLYQIQLGEPLGEESKLVKCAGKPSVYLLDGSKKRHVKNEAAMDANGFNAKKVQDIDCTTP